jgi:hypothetical protein
MKINIDITDWNEEYQARETDVSSEDKIIERSKEGIKPSEMARLAIVARERGDAPDDILPKNKPMLNKGGAISVSTMIAKRMKEITLENGKQVKVRKLTCPTEGVENVVVESYSKNGVKNALNYLHNTILGYVYGRLVIIAENGGDVEKEWAEFKRKGDEMVKELV